MFSGGPIQHLRQGWALFPFQGRTPHYWVEDTTTMPPKVGAAGRVRYYMSSCGLHGVTNAKVPALGVGDYQACKRCQQRTGKKPDARDRLTFADTM